MTKRFGFTLAEVLITLTIIGVIAAMTVPTLLNSTADQEYKTGLKKAVSTINQALTMHYALEGTDLADYIGGLGNGTATADGTAMNNVPTSGTTGGVFSTDGVIGGVFAQRMQITDSTTKARSSGKVTAGTQTNAILYLSDGMVLEIPSIPGTEGTTLTKNCKKEYYSEDNRGGCLFSMVVDVNGDKGKCLYGGFENDKPRPKDCFVLDVYPDRVVPAHKYAKEIMYENK